MNEQLKLLLSLSLSGTPMIFALYLSMDLAPVPVIVCSFFCDFHVAGYSI